jgi:hypothetical protein
LKLSVKVFYNDSYGNLIDDVKNPAAGVTPGPIHVKGSVVNASWEVLIKKKKANPFLLFTKPYFEWRQANGSVKLGAHKTSGKLSGAIFLNCGPEPMTTTHSVQIIPTIRTK